MTEQKYNVINIQYNWDKKYIYISANDCKHKFQFLPEIDKYERYIFMFDEGRWSGNGTFSIEDTTKMVAEFNADYLKFLDYCHKVAFEDEVGDEA